jgi:transposase
MLCKLNKIRENACGIDIGSESIFTAVEGQEVTTFNTYTRGYRELIVYLKLHNVKSIAMEATGVYWYALYKMLVEAGFEVYLVNGRQTRSVPGRKTDVQDCQWLMQLHAYGLLRKSFIPEEIIRKLRTYTRQREENVERGAAHVQHMQKALISMNIRLHQVISKITGVSGLKVLKAILKGERNAQELLALCDKRIVDKKTQEFIDSLDGYYTDDHLFALQQGLDGYEFFEKQRLACDAKIELLLNEMGEGLTEEVACPTINEPRPSRHNDPQVKNLHSQLVKINGGIDCAQISGFSDKMVLKLLGEVGTDLSLWKDEKHFTSWLGLTPRYAESGKIKKKRRNPAKTKAGQIFKEAAMSIANSKYLAMGSFYQRIKAKRGAQIAIKATARKLAVQFYQMMTKGYEYVEQGVQKYEELQKKRLQNYLLKKAQLLGYQIVDIETGTVVT